MRASAAIPVVSGRLGPAPMDVGMVAAYAHAVRARVAGALWVAAVVLVTGAAAFDVVNRASGSSDPWLPGIVAAALGFCTVGALIAGRHPGNPIGWLILAIGVGNAVSGIGIGYGTWAAMRPGAAPGAAVGLWLGKWAWCAMAVLPAVFLLFPSGTLPTRRLRPVLWAALAVAPVFAAGVAVAPGRLSEALPVDNPFAVAAAGLVLDAGASVLFVLFVGLLLVALGSLAWRLRDAVGDERRRLAWVLLGSGVLALQLPFEATGVPAISGPTSALFITVFCVSLGIAMVRHRLYEIDFILNRALVYGTLTICLLLLYAGVVALLGAALRDRAGFAASLVAAGVVAVVLAPLRARLQRGVDRMLYGQRGDPFAVMSQLGRRLERAAPPEMLPALAEEVAATLKLPRVTIELNNGDTAAHGAGGGEPLVLPLAFQGRQVGQLMLSPRGPREVFSRAERELLDGVARQLGVAAYAVGLTADLQRSRERLVAAREEERRRLRRDLHDGLGPLLAGISLRIAAARNLLRAGPDGDPDAADVMLDRLDRQTQGAVADVRRLVDDLRPPALDELGLVSAIREQAARFEGTLAVSVEASGELGDLPAAVEVAAFRIATEAITNSARHAEAHICHVCLTRDGALQVEVRDDGRGLPAQIQPGVGLTSIGERAAELGGTWSIGPSPDNGTVVTARLPVMKA
jgi:two-component system NarL family sensor kinase